MNPRVTSLAVYDLDHAKGVASDLSHINTKAKVSGHCGANELADALKGAEVVIIPAGLPRKPGMERDDLFNTNAKVVFDLTTAIAKTCPKALVAIITNPVNSTVAIAAEVLTKAGVYDPKRLFGVTTLDVTRSRTFVAERKSLNVDEVEVPVIGGHAGGTILPILSQTSPATTFSDEERDSLTVRIQNGGTEVVQAKAGKGSATLSMALAGAEFVDHLLKGLGGVASEACTMVESDVVQGCRFFANRVKLGPNGVAENLGLGKLSDYEKAKLEKEVVPELASSIQKGIEFAAKSL
jgi:malate dehydrogenase